MKHQSAQSAARSHIATSDLTLDLIETLDRKLDRASAIPPGWRPIAKTLRVKLAMVAREHPERVVGELTNAGVLLALRSRDRVVNGMLRRANARAAAACRICGARARYYPQLGLAHGYCARHGAVHWLQSLIEQDLRLTTTTKALPPPLPVPRALVALWIDHHPAPARAEIRTALQSGQHVIALDVFDTPTFLDWLKGYASAIERLRRDQQREVPADRSPGRHCG